MFIIIIRMLGIFLLNIPLTINSKYRNILSKIDNLRHPGEEINGLSEFV